MRSSVRSRGDSCAWLALSLAWLLGGPALAAPPGPTACVAGTRHTFSATGAFQAYAVPADAAAVYVVADGASGGAQNGNPGGHGAHLAAQVPVSGPVTLNVVVGVAGGTGRGQGISSAGGGGGGSFVYTPDNLLLGAAGGGGGAASSQMPGVSQGGHACFWRLSGRPPRWAHTVTTSTRSPIARKSSGLWV